VQPARQVLHLRGEGARHLGVVLRLEVAGGLGHELQRVHQVLIVPDASPHLRRQRDRHLHLSQVRAIPCRVSKAQEGKKKRR
jgi:hypothetical protein